MRDVIRLGQWNGTAFIQPTKLGRWNGTGFDPV